MTRVNSVKWVRILILILGVSLLVGCAGYYKVEDPSTGNIYYTTDIDRESNGSVRFVDKNTDSEVTLQNSAVTEINSEEFKANTKKK